MTRVSVRGVGILAIGFAVVSVSARADEPDILFAGATEALAAGKPADAIANLEALADRGVVDAAMSFDRGLAYAERVRIGAEQPGDLGRAAHGFEEARILTRDPKLVDDATAALVTIRAEVSRRRARAGGSMEIEQTDSLGDSVVHLLSEDTWAILSTIASVLFGVGLFVRRQAKSGEGSASRVKIGGTVASAVFFPLSLALVTLTLFARDERMHRRDGIIVSPGARPSDAHGVVLPGAGPLPEAARVRILGANAAWTEVRWGTLDAWVPSPAVRPLRR